MFHLVLEGDDMLSGRVALLVGSGDDSISRSVALTLAMRQVRIAVCYTERDEDIGAAVHTDRLIGAIRDMGGEVLALPVDLTQPDTVGPMVNDVLAAYGKVDILVSRVGMRWDPCVAAHLPPEDIDATVQAEIEGTLQCIEGCLPAMSENGWGRILAIGPFEPVCWTIGSSASAARHFLSLQFERHERPYNITFNLIHPGWAVVGPGRPEAALAAARHDPAWQARRHATAQDVADAAVFLCGESARFITGSQLFFAME